MYCNVFMQKVIQVARLRTNNGLSFMSSTGSRVCVNLLKLQEQAVTVVMTNCEHSALVAQAYMNEYGYGLDLKGLHAY